MPPGRSLLLYLTASVLFASAFVLATAEQAIAQASQAAPTLVLKELGKGTAPLDGPWQFHLGDDPAWAGQAFDDSGWEQITADQPWGAQSHPSYAGYAWYRRHITLSPAEGASPDVALLIPAIDDAYELYWNGVPVGHLGSLPPHLDWMNFVPAQTYGLGPVRSGVLAVRVYKVALSSTDDGTAGGFEALPIIGSPEAIAAKKDALDFRWLRGQQFRFALTVLYGLASLLSLIAWLRDRREKLLFWMAVYTAMPLLELAFNGLRLPISNIWLTFLVQTSIQIREISQWYLLLWLLQLDVHPKLFRFVRVAAIISFAAGTLDGLLSFVYPPIMSVAAFQIADAVLTFFILPFEAIPTLLVVYAMVRRKRLDSARWLVAGFALVAGTFYSVQNIASQGTRFTHWTLAAKMVAPQFTLFGSTFPIQSILRTLLFLSIVYAVVRYASENRRRQAVLEQEFQNARELQQLLIPETLPALPGYAVTSAYRPAQEVGGDFFQILPLEGEHSKSMLIVLGDVSGKGLKAAMTVSLIVGAVRTLVETTSSPAEVLAGLNRRLHGRMQEGFATCLALRLDPHGHCVLASAGHPAPYLNEEEVELPGALPLGLISDSGYEETSLKLRQGDHFALYTDGLLEARNASGEIFSFERLDKLFAGRPDAAEASEAAVHFGQDDDITVLTFTRLAVGQESTTTFTNPFLARTT